MKYTVVWQPSALNRLATLWLNAADRAAVARAADEIDRRLAHDPDLQGEQRVRLIRVLLVDPLGVYFRVRPADRVAEVFWVWRSRH